MLMPVSTPALAAETAVFPTVPAIAVAVVTDALARVEETWKPVATARNGSDRRRDRPMLNGYSGGYSEAPSRCLSVGAAQLGGAGPAAAGLLGCRLTSGFPCRGLFWLSLRNNNAPPPTASITGHSTRPTAPSAPKANAAAGVE